MIASTKEAVFPVVHENDADGLEHDEVSFTEITSSEMKARKFQVKEIALSSPIDVLSTEEGLLIVDADKNHLVLTDARGKVLRVIGKTGNGEDSFLTPTAVTTFEDQYYVIDQGNHRVKVLDDAFRFLHSIPLPEIQDEDDKWFTNIAVDKEGCIFISGNHLRHAGIYRAGKSDTNFSMLFPNYIGDLLAHDSHLYALNRGTIYANPESLTVGDAGFRNFLWDIDGEKIENKVELPTKMLVRSFILGEKLYVLSYARQGILAFESESQKYQKIVSINPANEFDFPNSMTMMEGDIYIADPENHQILKVEGVE